MAGLVLSIGAHFAGAQVNVTTFHNDIGRTGQNLSETTLNTTNVNATQFGKLFSQAVDGQVYAQPLYLSGVTINGAVHNVIYVATENDSVYAFDADSNGGANATPLWQASMLSTTHGAVAGETTIPSSTVSTDISPKVGITGTPVIDPTTNTLYVVSAAILGSAAVQRLHALDITTGAEKFGGPVKITATAAGTGNGSVSGTLTFDQLWENQRPGLLLLNGIVWLGFAAHGDNGPWHGWVIGYNAATLVQTGAYCSTPNGDGGGFWMSGEGLAADVPAGKPYGRMFVPTGNGDYTATSPYTNKMDYGDSELVLDLTNGVPTITDEFTPNTQAMLNSEDGDIASGGLMVIPTQTTGTYPDLAVQIGKSGTMYLLNRDNMGGYHTPDQAVQEQTYAVGGTGAWSTPAYWNGTVYWWGRSDVLKAFPLVNGLLSTAPTKSTESYGYPGATPSVSANGSSQGILWTVDSEAYTTSGPAILQAHNASNVASTLYSSATNASRDKAGIAVKFSVPTVANGKVYVPAGGEVDIYGLLNGATQTSAPVISPGTESYANTLTVTITDATNGAAIYYTTNGAAATASSTLYTGPFQISSSVTVNAVASSSGALLSAQSSATYTNVTQASTVVFSIPTGTYSTVQSLLLSDTTSGAQIYYTTDGSTPTTASTPYTGAITINATETVTAIAAVSGLSNSVPLAQTYTIVIGLTGISFPNGFAASGGLVDLNGSTSLNDSRLQLTNGLTAEAGTAWYYQKVNIQSFTTDFTFQLSNPVADGITFTIQNANAGIGAIGANGAGLGFQGILKSVAIKFDLYNSGGFGTNTTGLYLNGVSPASPAVSLAGTGINLLSDDAMAIHLTYDGTTLTMTITDMVTAAVYNTSWAVNIPTAVGANTAYVGFTGSTGAYTASQKILTWSYYNTSSTATATPTFTPVAGTYTTAQTVAISDATPAASIYYTLDGSTPTTASALYSSPIAVNASETINAIGVASGYTNSVVGSAAYVISSGAAATPSFTPAGGTYAATQTVTIASTTAGAKIYYTTNGTTPTTASTLYSGPISVPSSVTIEAIAVATGYTNSAVATAAYSITLTAATPSFTPAGGTYTAAQTVTIASTTSGAKIYYTLNGTTPTTASTLYTAPISIPSSVTVEAIAVATGYTNSAVATAAYSINLSTAATPSFTPAGGTYAATQTVTIASATAGAKIYYTTNGTTPTTASTLYSAPVSVASSETLEAIAVVTGYTNSAAGVAAYTISASTTAPIFSAASGTYAYAPTLTITDSNSSAKIYYTTNGTTPTTASTLYTAPIAITQAKTVEAIAVVGSTTSPVTTASYVLAAAAPVISPAGGTYSGPVTVTLSTTTPYATIYYTTAGNVPTTSSTKYTEPFIVSAHTIVKAFTGETNYTASAVVTATYDFAATATATPTFSPAGGTYASAQTVAISDVTAGAVIYYTTDGSTPTTSSAVYSSPITVASSETLQTLAVAPSAAPSPVATAAYVIGSFATLISYPTAFTTTGLSLNGGSAVTSGALSLTTNVGAENRSAWYSTAVNIQQFTTDFNFQQTSATADGMTFAIQNSPNNIYALGPSGQNLGYAGLSKSVAVKFDLYSNSGEGSNSTGFYTNGAVPTVPALDMTASGVNLHSGDIMHAHITYDGTTLTLLLTDTVTNASYTYSQAINIPTTVGANTAYVGFTAATGGSYATQNVLNWTYTVPN